MNEIQDKVLTQLRDEICALPSRFQYWDKATETWAIEMLYMQRIIFSYELHPARKVVSPVRHFRLVWNILIRRISLRGKRSVWLWVRGTEEAVPDPYFCNCFSLWLRLREQRSQSQDLNNEEHQPSRGNRIVGRNRSFAPRTRTFTGLQLGVFQTLKRLCQSYYIDKSKGEI
jgi:hypothetical protein